MTQVTVHYRRVGQSEWEELTLQIQKQSDRPSSLEYHDVSLDYENIGTYWRDPTHRTHQVFGRIRYDNKPRTAFKRVPKFEERASELWRETRVQALGDILKVHFKGTGGSTIHVKGRAPRWVTCGVCDGRRSHSDEVTF